MADGLDAFSTEHAPSVAAGDSERALLAAVLADETRSLRAAERAAGVVTATCFATGANGRVWQAIQTIVARGDTPDVPMVAEELAGDTSAQAALVAAASLVVAPSAFEQHAARVAGHAFRRTVKGKLREAVRALDETTDPDAATRSAFEVLAAMPRTSKASRDDTMLAAVTATLERILTRYEAALNGARPTARWGVFALDGGTLADGTFFEGAVGGMFPGKLYVLSGVPGAGKTSLAWCAALATARGDALTPGKRVLVFSLEMSREDICQRLAAQACGVSEARIENGRITQTEVGAICTFLRDDLARLPINVVTSCRTIEEMRARVLAELAAVKPGDPSTELGLVVIDFLQRTKVGRRTDDANRDDQERVYEAKGIANEGVPVLAISSMSKSGQAHAEEGKVGVRDASGSGSEYAADMMAFLVRTDPNDTGGRVEVRFEVAKQRNGPRSSTTLVFDMVRGVFDGQRASGAHAEVFDE